MRTTTPGPVSWWPRDIFERYGYLLAVLCIAVSTAVFIPGRAHFAKGQWALLYLLIIGFVASVSGVRPAVVAAVVAFFAWNYFFLPPYHTFYIQDPQDWGALFAFLVVGVAVGIQTGRMRQREAEAVEPGTGDGAAEPFQRPSGLGNAHPGDDALLVELSRITEAECAILFLPDETGKLRAVQPSAETACEPDPAALLLAEWAQREAKAVGLPPAGPPSEAGEGWPYPSRTSRPALACQEAPFACRCYR